MTTATSIGASRGLTTPEEYIEKIVRHLKAHGGCSTTDEIDRDCGLPPEHGLYGHPSALKSFSCIWIERQRKTLVVLRSN